MTDSRLLSPSPASLSEAARLLGEGKLVAFPTETVYGLGADATNDQAVAAIFAAKDRPAFNPLIVHIPDLAAAEALVEFDTRASTLAARLWPGPLTLVLKRRRDCPVSLLASAGLETLAVRIPAHELAHTLLETVGCPIAAPSANRSEEVSPTRATHVLQSLGGRIDAVLDGGPCQVGLESTVLDLSGPMATLLRPGGVPAEDIEAVTGPLAEAGKDAPPKSPGLLSRHYAPRTPLRMNARTPAEGEALLAFGPDTSADTTRNLSPDGDLTEAAANLFAVLRELDEGGFTGIAVRPIPEDGLGRAINDRLRRAAGRR